MSGPLGANVRGRGEVQRTRAESKIPIVLHMSLCTVLTGRTLFGVLHEPSFVTPNGILEEKTKRKFTSLIVNSHVFCVPVLHLWFYV